MPFDDAKLAYLLNLGFDHDKCLTALNLYDDLQEASNWILSSQNEVDVQSSLENNNTTMEPPQHIMSPPLTASSSNIFKDTSYQDQQELNRQRTESAKRSTEIIKQKRLDQEARRRVLDDIKEDRAYAKQLKPSSGTPKQQVSSSETSMVTDDTEQTSLSHIQQELKKQKKLDRLAKQRVLDDIKKDRMDKQQQKQADSSTERVLESSVPVNRSVNKRATSTPKTDHQTALIQFKLSNGSTVRHSFLATDLLDSLFRFAGEQETNIGKPVSSNESICLISAFPRRSFGPEENSLSVQEAGFIPNVSLNVGRISSAVEAPAVDITMAETSTRQEDEEMQQADEDDIEEDEDEEDIDEHFIRQPVVDPHRSRRRRIADRSPFARQNRVTNPNWSWGRPGYRLGDENPDQVAPPVVADNSTEQAEDPDRRQNMLAAIQQRVSQKGSMDNSSMHLKKLNRNIKSLKETCASQVAAILSSSSKDTQRLLKDLVCLSPNLANILLNRLMETRKLDRLSISRLIRHCYLQQVSLDSYVYATDSLLEELSNANTLTKLVLHGCDLITDAGIRQLEGLRYLEHLDVSNCKITDKGLKSITELSSLMHLNLSKTHITDAGLQWFTSRTQCQPSLETLLLSGCKNIKSAATFTSIQGFSALTHLSLGGTDIGKQEVTPQAMKLLNRTLESLDVGNTGLTDDDLIQLVAGFGQLKELKLGGCNAMTTAGLARFAKGMLHLEMIQFPNREHELDDILIRFTDTPLRHLDLTGFLNVTDDGVKHIAQMTRMQYLSLTGTKVTDEGIVQLKRLEELEKLYLDQTHLTDRGILALKGLTKLNTLSLGRTQLTNASLIAMGNTEETRYAPQLRTLNLQNCLGVSDKGIKALANMNNLTNLNLDHTNVSLHCGIYLKDLEFLKPVRLLGIDKQEDDDMDTD